MCAIRPSVRDASLRLALLTGVPTALCRPGRKTLGVLALGRRHGKNAQLLSHGVTIFLSALLPRVLSLW